MSVVSRCTHRLKDWIVLKKFKNETLRLVKFCKKALWWFLFCCITVDWWDDRIFLSAITPVYFFSHTRRRQPPTLHPLQKSYKVNTQVQFGLLASKMAFRIWATSFVTRKLCLHLAILSPETVEVQLGWIYFVAFLSSTRASFEKKLIFIHSWESMAFLYEKNVSFV